jgi:hypothetical protein
MDPDDGLTWRTSTFSSNNGNGCVEVAFGPGGEVLVRDTKDRRRAPHRHSPTGWAAFLAGVRADRFPSP